MSKHAANQTVQAMQEAIVSTEALNGPERKPRRWLVWGLVALIVIALATLAAPWIATRSSVRDYLIAQAVPAEAASISMQSVSCGWFSPVEIQGLQVLDGESQMLVEVGSVTLDRTLLQLAQDYTNLGQITVDSPTVHLSLRPDGSNLEDTIAKLVGTESTESQAAPMISVNVKVQNARILATEQATGRQWNVEQLNAEADLPSAASENWVVIANGTLNGKPFAIETATPIGLATDTWPLGPVGNAKVTAQQLPLEPLRYAALRSGQPIQHLAGLLSLNAVAKWSPIPGSDPQSLPQFEADAVVRTENFQFAEPSLLGQDALQITGLQLETSAQLIGDVVSVKSCNLNSDFGNASLQTSAKLSELSDTAAIVNTIRQQQLRTSGRLDIAALARALPNTLKVRDDVQVANGLFVWDVNSTPNHDGAGTTRWVGQASTEDIQILRAGQPIQWNFPLKIDFAVLDGKEPQVENVLVKSDFFELTGQGKLRQGAFQAKADLEKLVLELDQLVDLGGMYVNGGMQSIVQWNEAQPNQLQLKAQAQLTDFVMAQNEQLLCQEKELLTVVETVATLDGQTIASLDSGRVDVASANDFFIAQLQKPVAKPDANSTWPIVCRLKGGLGTWFARLKTMGMGHGWDVAGEIDTNTIVEANQRGIAVQRLVVDARNVEAITDGIHVKEPVVQIETAGTVDLSTFACRFPTTTVGAQSVAFSANNVSVDMEPGFVVAGDIGYRADIGRLMSYTVTDPAAATTKVTGEASGRLHLEAKEQTTSFQIVGDVAKLQVDQLQADPNLADAPATMQTVWQEDKLSMETLGSYDAAQDQLVLREARVEGKVLNLSAQGSADKVATSPTVNVSGEYGYQLEGLLAIFRDMIGPDVQLTGNQRQRFAIQGPLFPAVANEQERVSKQLVAQGGIGWDTANIYETQLGAAQVNALLQDGVMRMSPLQLAVGEGQINVAPTVHVNTEPLWMTIDPTTVADHIRITPEMTKTWMKYLAPLLADATNAEGTFSVALSRAEVPLMDPTSGNISGQFIVHGGALGPGPLATQFIEMATNIKRLTGQGEGQITNATGTWVELGEQQVTFQVAENRVYHEGFQMIIDGVPVRTRGSVGILDDSINVMAEVPIMDQWIAGNEALAGLRGQTIQIPVTGTTSRPQLDQQAIANVTRQMAGVAARGFLQKEVGKQLQKTLGVGNVQDAIGGAQEKLNTKLQDELGKQLNRFFK